jgi:hypothetical protein
MRNGTKRDEIYQNETKRNETKRNLPKRSETERNVTERNKIKRNLSKQNETIPCLYQTYTEGFQNGPIEEQMSVPIKKSNLIIRLSFHSSLKRFGITSMQYQYYYAIHSHNSNVFTSNNYWWHRWTIGSMKFAVW